MGKSLRRWIKRRFGRDGGLRGVNSLRTKQRSSNRLFGAKVQRRRRFLRILMVILAALVSALLALEYTSGGILSSGWDLSKIALFPPSQEEEDQSSPENAGGRPVPGSPPEQTNDSPEAVAYATVASEIPGIEPESVQVYKSKLDPSWASVHILTPEEGTWVLFLKRDGSWKALKSIRADEPDAPQYEEAVLDEVPKDLVDSLYPQNPSVAADPSGLLAEPVDTGALPSVEKAKAPPAEAVEDEVPGEERERVDEGLEEVRKTIEDYGTEHDGIAGVFVRDVEGGYGYGVLPDEAFFGASVMKIPILVAVYRKIDEGEISPHDTFETAPEDWAGGAGWLQWQPAGTSHSVEDYLSLMMTQSDNVATNALMRIVGGPEYVNQVSSSLGAPDTRLYQKVTSERAAVPALDNRTTPRGMATILDKIATGEAASPESCREMISLMSQNHLESGLKAGVPEGVEVAYKGGWLYKVYDDVGFVWNEDRPYVVAIFSKYGNDDPKAGKVLLEEISAGIWKAQDGSKSEVSSNSRDSTRASD